MTLPGDSGDSAQECCLEGENALSFTVGGLPQSCRRSAAVPRQPLEHHLEGIVKIEYHWYTYGSVHQKWRLIRRAEVRHKTCLQESCAGFIIAFQLLGPGGGAPSPRESEIQSIFKQRQAIVTLSACGGSVASDLRRRFERRKYLFRQRRHQHFGRQKDTVTCPKRG